MNYRISFAVVVVALLTALQVFGGDFASEVIQATLKFKHPDCSSTCFLVRRDEPDKAMYLVTASHVFESTKGQTAVLLLREPKTDGTYLRREHTISIRRGETPLWTRHPKEDVAVLRLAEPLPVAVRALPLTDLADEKRLMAEGLNTCSSIFTLTYPRLFEANEWGFPVARQGMISSHPFLPTQPNNRYLTDNTTFPGDSGGPVFVNTKEGRPLIIGIVIGEFRHDEKVSMEYQELTIQHPFGLGIVLYPQIIRETIENASRELTRTSEAESEKAK